MKVILHNFTTDLYFLGRNMWTNDPERALDFHSTTPAIWVAREAHLTDIELIVSLDTDHQLRVPLEGLDPVKLRGDTDLLFNPHSVKPELKLQPPT